MTEPKSVVLPLHHGVSAFDECEFATRLAIAYAQESARDNQNDEKRILLDGCRAVSI
jgi:hypothetical protein